MVLQYDLYLRVAQGLSHAQDMMIVKPSHLYSKAGEFLLETYARRQRVPVYCLENIPQDTSVPGKEAQGKTQKKEELEKHTKSILIQRKQRSQKLSDSDIEERIRTQE
jgi:hypothetical protein